MAKNQSNNTPETFEAESVPVAFVEKYKKLLIGAIVAIVAIVTCVILYSNYSNKRAVEAADAIAKCQDYFAQGNYDKALNGDGQGCVGFLAVINDFGSTKSGNLAHLYAGICYAQQEKWEEALQQLEAFDQEDDQMVSPQSLSALAAVYANLGQTEKAVTYYLKAAQKADNSTVSPFNLKQAGLLYESMGNTDKALECYQQIKSKYIDTPEAADIDKYIERLNK
ncbi:MAG: tetratricopeptide repeat protein [Bacteroidaceae bacterium]|nr:tetratricopeptide repeat protein [Bacteroidaceae bacterium]